MITLYLLFCRRLRNDTQVFRGRAFCGMAIIRERERKVHQKIMLPVGCDLPALLVFICPPATSSRRPLAVMSSRPLREVPRCRPL